MSAWVPALITGGAAFSAAIAAALVNRRAQAALAKRVADDNKDRDRRLAEQKVETEKILAHVNAQLARETAEEAANREYEFEARKQLYKQVRPLLFQMRELCEPSSQRIRRIVSGEIIVEDQHIRTTAQRLFAPLVVAQEMQRHLTAVDLSIDKTVRMQYLVARELLQNLHNGILLAEQDPAIPYLRARFPQGGRQHLTFAQLQRLVDFMTFREDDGSRRPRKQSELDDLHEANDPQLAKVLRPFSLLLLGSDPSAKPVLWRLLLAHAFFTHVLVDLVDRNASEPATQLPGDINDYDWSKTEDRNYFHSQRDVAERHVERRLLELRSI